MKKTVFSFLAKVIIFSLLATVLTAALPITQQVSEAAGPFYGKVPGVDKYSRIVFWYGTCNQTQIDTLKAYDVVVLEPTLKVLNVAKNQFYMESLTTNAINEIKRGVDGIRGNADDVIVLGYISVGEMLKTIIPGQSGHMTIQQGKDLGLLDANYSGPSGPVHGPNPWNYSSNGSYINVEGGAAPDGTYNTNYNGYMDLDIAADYSSYGSKISFTNQGYMPWYLDQQGATSDWISDSRYPQCGNGYWKKGDSVVDINKSYGGGYINAGDPAWQKFVTFQVDKLEHDCDFDGVFLDTVDTPDPIGGVGPSISWGPRGNFGWTAKGMVELVEKIKAVDPTKIVAANRGYWYFNPDEGTSQFADRYTHAINMFITESWYYNCYIPGFYDTSAGYEGNWNTNPSSANFRNRDNFGGFWKDYVNAQANKQDGFNVAIIDFQVPATGSPTGTQKWMSEVVEHSGYLGYDVSGAQNFNMGIYSASKDWLDSKGYPSANLTGFHDTGAYGGFAADGNFSEWNSVTPIFNDANATNSKGITKVYTKFVDDKFFMMIESKNSTINMAQEQILFDFDKDGPSGWQPSWTVSPDARIYFETMSQVGLFPYKGPNEVFSFDSPNSPTNRAWPVRTVQSGNKCELEFNKNYIFGSGMEGKEIWTWFRVANFGGANIKFTVGPSVPQAPVISNAAATAITQTGATITWTTDSESDSKVEYGTTADYGRTASGNSGVKSHSVSLSGLTPNTLYHYRVKSTNNIGTTTSSDYIFRTNGVLPVIASVSAVNISQTSATVTWSTDQQTDAQVEYGTTTAYGSRTTLNTVMSSSHSEVITGLTPGTLYHYRVTSKNANGDSATSGDYTFTTQTSGGGNLSISIDGNAADWSNISAIATASGQSTTSIKAAGDSNYLYFCIQGSNMNSYYDLLLNTDNNANSGYLDPAMTSSGCDYLVENGTLYSRTETSDVWSGKWSSLGTANVLVSKNASVCEIRITKSALSNLNNTISAGFIDLNTSWAKVSRIPASGALATYTGGGSQNPVAPIISSVSASGITQTGATIAWITDQTASSQVEFGTTTAYGNSTTINTALQTSHSETLTGLLANTLYHYRVKSVNANGTAVSSDYTFTTSGSVSGTILIDGSFSDWSGIQPLAVGTGTAKSISVTSDNGYLYLKLETGTTFTPSTTHQVYIDTDNSSSTGGNLWPDIGPDYKLIFQTAFNPPQLQKCNGGDTYSSIYTLVAADISYSGNYCEIRIPYTAFTAQLSSGQTVKFMYRAGETAAPGFWFSPKNTTYMLK